MTVHPRSSSQSRGTSRFSTTALAAGKIRTKRCGFASAIIELRRARCFGQGSSERQAPLPVSDCDWTVSPL